MDKAISLLEEEIKRLKNVIKDLRGRKLYIREAYRACEVIRFQRILDLLKGD